MPPKKKMDDNTWYEVDVQVPDGFDPQAFVSDLANKVSNGEHHMKAQKDKPPSTETGTVVPMYVCHNKG